MFPSLQGMLMLLQLGKTTMGVAANQETLYPARFLTWMNRTVLSSTDIPYGIHYLVNVTILSRIKSSPLHGFQQSFSALAFSA